MYTAGFIAGNHSNHPYILRILSVYPPCKVRVQCEAIVTKSGAKVQKLFEIRKKKCRIDANLFTKDTKGTKTRYRRKRAQNTRTDNNSTTIIHKGHKGNKRCTLVGEIIEGEEGKGEVDDEDEGETVTETGMKGFMMPDFHAEKGSKATS